MSNVARFVAFAVNSLILLLFCNTSSARFALLLQFNFCKPALLEKLKEEKLLELTSTVCNCKLLLVIISVRLLLFAFKPTDKTKIEYVNIEISYSGSRQYVTLDYTSGKRERRVYSDSERFYNKSRLEKQGFSVFVISNLRNDNIVAMKILKEFSDSGWVLNSHSKSATAYSDSESSGSTEVTNYILGR